MGDRCSGGMTVAARTLPQSEALTNRPGDIPSDLLYKYSPRQDAPHQEKDVIVKVEDTSSIGEGEDTCNKPTGGVFSKGIDFIEFVVALLSEDDHCELQAGQVADEALSRATNVVNDSKVDLSIKGTRLPSLKMIFPGLSFLQVH
ncbi:hypothetical protein HAX54_025535 [Datura stramonium]|uniref:Uncharacterized protein n=1 Tax=Datura stramonium TaxID=4076 RepID=A0ABS8RNI5_DATST|nr:hypothetical protein [Datura stramonium]